VTIANIFNKNRTLERINFIQKKDIRFRRMMMTVSRRKLLKVAGIMGAVIIGISLLTACGGDEQVDLTHFVWVGGGQGVIPREVVPAYMEENPNVEIELYEGTNSVTYPKMVAAAEADPDNPLINFGFFNIDATVKGAKDDMWESLDPELIPNMNDVLPAFWRDDNKGIGWGLAQVGLMYNCDLVDEPPDSWLDLVDPKYEGKVVAFDYPFDYMLTTIARSIGGSATDDEGAWELIKEAAARGQFLAFGSSNEDIKSPMVRGEALIAPWFAGMVDAWVEEEGVPLCMAEPKEGYMAFPLYFQIAKGSTEAEIAHASSIINTYLSPEVLSRYSCLTRTPHSSTVAETCDELINSPYFDPAVIARGMMIDWDTVAARDVEWRERWDREVKAVMP
jgi:putative spermidine/putrescine transport system substrate-binding protein